MNNKERILFIGGINGGREPQGGVDAKNQIMLQRLKSDPDFEIDNLDVSKFRHSLALSAVQMIINLFRYNRFMFSLSDKALEKISYLNFILKRKKVTIFIVGGRVYERLDNPRFNNFMKNVCKIYAETNTLKELILEKCPGANVERFPNFKEIPQGIKFLEKAPGKTVKLLYLSSIRETKGIFRCMEIVEKLNQTDKDREYKLSIYGNFKLTDEERARFDKLVAESSFLSFDGFIELSNPEAYKILADHDMMLFLTNHPGEGFPGIIIDAMIAGLPVIASDWRYNAELLETENGQLGKIIDLNDDFVTESCLAIQDLIADEQKYIQLRKNMQRESEKYDVNKIKFNIC